MEGRKDDSGKVALDLVAPGYVEGTAAVLQFGSVKYAPYNWAKGMKWSRVFAALMRHMYKWWRGEKVDPETGISHLYHASCCLMFLSEYETYTLGEDDRPTYFSKEKDDTTTNSNAAVHSHVEVCAVERG